MATYSVTLTDGTGPILIAEGSVDTTYSIPLLGQNTTNYGEEMAQALVWSLQNFANPLPPSDISNGSKTLLKGQLWYDTTANTLKLYDGAAWDQVVTTYGNVATIIGTVVASADSTYDIGATANRWRLGYFDDLSVSNGANTGQITADVLAASSNATSPALKITGTTYTTTTFGDIYVDGTDLWFVNGGGTPVNISAASSTPAFNDLSDVTLTGPSQGQVLWFDSGAWKNNAGAISLNAAGKLTTLVSGTGTAGLNLPHGAAPSAPANGDVWTTSAGGMYVRINGVTVGPLGAGGGGGAVDSFNSRTGTVVPVVTDYSDGGSYNFYPRKDASAPAQTIEAAAGVWTFNNRPAFASTGAPFTVTSNTQVANLTASNLYDGVSAISGSAFAQKAATTTIIGAWTFPGAGASGLKSPVIYGNSTSVSIYYGTSGGTAAIVTQDHTATDKLSAATVVGGDSVARDIGYAAMVPATPVESSGTPFTQATNQQVIYKTTTATPTYTVPTSTAGALIPSGAMYGVANRSSSGNITISCATNLYYMTGSAASTGSTRTIAPGGIATLWKVSDSEWWIYGSGIT